MLELAYARGGSLLKFGGDALLLLFTGEQRVLQGCSAAVEMRAALREAAQIQTSVGRVPLKMSVGVHDGTVDVFSVGGSHRELIISGPDRDDDDDDGGDGRRRRDPGQPRRRGGAAGRFRRSSSRVRAASCVGAARRWRRAARPPAPPSTRARTKRACRVALRDHLDQHRAESEHRLATIAFVKFKGVDGLLASEGPKAWRARWTSSCDRCRPRPTPKPSRSSRPTSTPTAARSSSQPAFRPRETTTKGACCASRGRSWMRRTVSRSASAYIVGTCSAARSARRSARRTRSWATR